MTVMHVVSVTSGKVCYDPQSGEFRWAVGGRGIREGGIAGSLNADGYRVIRFNSKPTPAHRLAWFLVHDEWPVEIDHINGDRSDNRLCNLRSVPHSVNMQNKRSAMSNNASCGLLGVTWNKQHQRWQSKIMVNKKPAGNRLARQGQYG